ncbi:baculoviral IAP repeat-containing protein 7 isoform X2 [Tupaia chinensis]|uniref:baculoviral IAP repeat-containing protein 7 isoform X2 n=1 Tax=Tupaia chinensis TaxID=246437 RepID=UPI0003C8C574|nr:baculoviral IAP repeat-containing protein 7 isoform X2 [Tupaia chinensis]
MEPKGRTECSGAWSRWAAGEGLAGEQHRLCPPWGSAQGQDDIDGQILGQLHPPAEGEGEAGPAFPGMGSEELRLASFYSWPPTTGVRPELLAAAGFFHTGRQDKVRCFFCYGGLQSWEQGDDPWIEHAKWFPRCQFLLQSKGRAFVHSVQQSPPHLSSWGLWEEPEDAAPHTLSGQGFTSILPAHSCCPRGPRAAHTLYRNPVRKRQGARSWRCGGAAAAAAGGEDLQGVPGSGRARGLRAVRPPGLCRVCAQPAAMPHLPGARPQLRAHLLVLGQFRLRGSGALLPIGSHGAGLYRGWLHWHPLPTSSTPRWEPPCGGWGQFHCTCSDVSAEQ